MDKYFKKLLHTFKGKKYNDFIEYVYFTFDKQINSIKKNKDKDKYIKIRNSVLSYIIANEKVIVSELNKKNLK